MTTNSADHPLLDENSESKLRWLLGPFPCIFGFHGWGKPRAINSLSMSGEKQADGSWEHDVDSESSKEVSQLCNHCNRVRYRSDLDWDDVRDARLSVESGTGK